MLTLLFARRLAQAALAAAAIVPAVASVAPAARAQGVSPLVWSARQSFVFDSNVYRLPQGYAPSIFGGPRERGDRTSITSLNLSIDKRLGMQRVLGEFGVQHAVYARNSRLDFDGYQADLHWQWVYGRQWFGTLSTRNSLAQIPFSEFTDRTTSNLIQRNGLMANAHYRLTPDWSAFVGLRADRRDSQRARESSDWRQDAWEAGFRYLPETGAMLSLLVRAADGRYPTRSVFDASGNPLPVTVDNAYRQHDLLLRAQHAPSDKSRFGMELGLAERRFENLGQRDFRGAVWLLDADWYPGGAWRISAAARREIGAAEMLTANYVDQRTLSLSAAWQVTGRLSVQGSIERYDRSFDGDPGFVLGLGPKRQDRTQAAGVAVAWDVWRIARLTAGLRRERRESNVFSALYEADVFTLGISASFD